jgi:hypothetical protein
VSSPIGDSASVFLAIHQQEVRIDPMDERTPRRGPADNRLELGDGLVAGWFSRFGPDFLLMDLEECVSRIDGPDHPATSPSHGSK